MTERGYRIISFTMAIVFLVVGLIFLFIPGRVIGLFNDISLFYGGEILPVKTDNIYPVLAVSYMYLVSLLAFFMYRWTEEKIYPLLLSHGKWASSLLSLVFFLTRSPHPIFMINFIIDGLIGILALFLYYNVKERII